ncbi:MAG: hypothetical protein WKF77_28040 [Planctomycetaceae bacterium]
MRENYGVLASRTTHGFPGVRVVQQKRHLAFADCSNRHRTEDSITIDVGLMFRPIFRAENCLKILQWNGGYRVLDWRATQGNRTSPGKLERSEAGAIQSDL